MISTEMIDIMGPALCAALLIALTHVPFGLEILKRGIIFIDLAVAQIAGLGIIVAAVFFHAPPPWLTQLAVLAFAVLAGLLFHWIETHVARQWQEAIIGCGFVLAGALAILLLSEHPHGDEKIRHLLSGQILLISWDTLFKHAPVYLLTLALWFIKPIVRKTVGFYLLFAFVITSSIQLAGVYVVFASLILPALAAVNYARPYPAAWGCGIVSVSTGICISAFTDLPAGAAIVVTYGITTAAMAMRGWRLAARCR